MVIIRNESTKRAQPQYMKTIIEVHGEHSHTFREEINLEATILHLIDVINEMQKEIEKLKEDKK